MQKELTAEEYLQISRDEAEKALQTVLDGFDFNKAARALSGCDWKYNGADNSPSAEELKIEAREIVMRVIQQGSKSSIHSGPLMVEAKHYDTPAVVSVELRLVPVYESAVYIDGRVIFAKKQRKFVPKPPSSITQK